MQRLLTAAGAVALVVLATVFNALRYPSVSVQLWRASQAMHGPAPEPTTVSAGNLPSGGSRLFNLAEHNATNTAEQQPAALAPESTIASQPAPAGASAGNSQGGNSQGPSEATPFSNAEGRFTPDAGGSTRAGRQALSERAVWPTWRSEQTAPPRTDVTPTPPQPFGMLPRARVAAGGESPLPSAPPAAAEAAATDPNRPSATRVPAAEQPPRPTASPGIPTLGAAMPRLPADFAPTTRTTELVPVVAPSPTAKPGPEPASDSAAVWSPAGASSLPARRSAEPFSPSSGGLWLSTAMPPPAPIPDHHRADLVPVERPKAAAGSADAEGVGPALSWRRLPPVDDGPTAPINPSTAAQLPAYPSTRTP